MKQVIKKIIYSLCRILPISKNKILFFSYYGEKYAGSPKYLSEYMDQNYKDKMKVVWAFVNPTKYNLSNTITRVRYSGIKYYYMLATAKVIITNYRMTDEFKKRNGQIYIQTWHSSLRLKMIEKDAEESLPEHYVKMAKNDSKQIDYLLAGSNKAKEIFERAFWYSGEILDYGTPQCDMLFENNTENRKKVCDYFGVPYNAKFILYAPTFRKNNSLEAYNLDYTKLMDKLNAQCKDEWYLLIRLHPHLINYINKIKYNKNILQATKYNEVQELISAADILITDYSAIMFDFALTKKKCILYVPDYNEYVKQDRRLYFDIKKLPFPAVMTQEQLEDEIINENDKNYKKKVSKFLEEEIITYDDGNACKKVCDKIGELIV